MAAVMTFLPFPVSQPIISRRMTFHRAVFTIARQMVRLGFFASPTRHIFVAFVNVSTAIVATRVGETPDEPC
jgi:hypothetical protein